MGTDADRTTALDPAVVRRDVMVLESHPGAARRAVEQLTVAGYTVHRCHDVDAPAFPCNALVGDSSCPLDGSIDVALVVRRGVTPRPTQAEDGVTCALRAGIPVVEDGSDLLDPYAPFLTARVWSDEDVVTVLERAVRDAMAPLEASVTESLVPFLTAADRSPGAVHVRAEPRGKVLHLHLEAPGLDDELCSRLSVKAADTVRAETRRWDAVEVSLTA